MLSLNTRLPINSNYKLKLVNIWKENYLKPTIKYAQKEHESGYLCQMQKFFWL
jgi:hypothetical protein